MPTTDIGPCECCGQPGCCPNLPETLTATITSTGDCGCWNGTYTLELAYENFWSSSAFNGCPDSVGGGIIVKCEEGQWYIIANYTTNTPVFGAGCALGEAQNEVTATCEPLYIEFTTSVNSYLGGSCCGGTVTVVVTE